VPTIRSPDHHPHRPTVRVEAKGPGRGHLAGRAATTARRATAGPCSPRSRISCCGTSTPCCAEPVRQGAALPARPVAEADPLPSTTALADLETTPCENAIRPFVVGRRTGCSATLSAAPPPARPLLADRNRQGQRRRHLPVSGRALQGAAQRRDRRRLRGTPALASDSRR